MTFLLTSKASCILIPFFIFKSIAFINLEKSIENISFPKMVASIVTAPLFFLPDINFPTLAYLFTERITGIEYGGANYYILLPGFFEEAVIIFGKELSFLYGFFVAIFIGIIYNFFKKINSTSLQSFMLQEINLITSFLLIVFLIGLIIKKERTNE